MKEKNTDLQRQKKVLEDRTQAEKNHFYYMIKDLE